jgi:hypothetical protein
MILHLKNTKGDVIELAGLNFTQQNIKNLAQALKDKNISKLSLNTCNIPDEQFKVLTTALKKNKTVKEFNLFNCGLSEQSAFALADLIKINQTLQSLDLEFNQFGASDVIAQAMQENTSMTTLKGFENNPIAQGYLLRNQLCEQAKKGKIVLRNNS